MLTYRHEKFLKQSVEAVLDQQTNFEFELILANDNSPDNTDQVVEEIKENHPKAYRLKYYKNPQNLGVMKNSRKALEMVQGQYFATCESDDYWCDPQKLQRQVDFLESHPDYSICFHNARIEYFEDFGIKEADYLRDNLHADDLLNAWKEERTFGIEDLIGEDEIWFMATASLMIRSSAFFPFPDWLEHSKSGDIPILILSARKGKIGYLPDVMAVYRKHAGGASLTDHKDDEVFLRNRIFMYRQLNKATEFRFNRLFKRNIARYYFMLLSSRQYQGHFFRKWKVIFSYICLTFPFIPHKRELIRDHLLPSSVLQLFRKLKGVKAQG